MKAFWKIKYKVNKSWVNLRIKTAGFFKTSMQIVVYNLAPNLKLSRYRNEVNIKNKKNRAVVVKINLINVYKINGNKIYKIEI